MLEKLQLIRSAIRAAVEAKGVVTFAQRTLNEDDLTSVAQFCTVTLSRSGQESDDQVEEWRIALQVGCYLQNPAEDEQLESLALIVRDAIEADPNLHSLISGVLYEGHQYPNEQGDDYAALDIQFEIVLN